jgi:small subunit ribosomal protein S11
MISENKDYLSKMAKAQKAQQSAKAAAKKRIVKVDAYGDAHVNATFNNIISALPISMVR